MSELELLPWPAVAVILRELGFEEIRCLSLTCTKLYSAVAELTTPEVKVVLPGSLDLPLKKPLLGLKVEIGDLFSESSWIDLEQLESLSQHPNYKVAKIKLGGGLESNPEKKSQAAHFLLSHHYLNSLLTAHSKARKKISHLDFEIDLLCFGCKKLLNEMQVCFFKLYQFTDAGSGLCIQPKDNILSYFREAPALTFPPCGLQALAGLLE